MQRVPFGILRQAIHPGGVRQPKLQPLLRDSNYDAKWISTGYTTGYSRGHAPGYAPSRHTYSPPPTTLNGRPLQGIRLLSSSASLPTHIGLFSHSAYRFFAGTSGTTRAKCRACEAIFVESDKRVLANHLKVNLCKAVILETIERIRRDKLCTVCDSRTERLKWGLPLCSENCEKAWMYFTPRVWTQARGLVTQEMGS